MPDLIEELKKDHEELIVELKKVNELNILKKEGQEFLFSLKERLLDHLKKEDEQIYSFLNEKAVNDIELRKTLNVLASDKDNFTGFAVSFFNNYTEIMPGIPPVDFVMDFGKLLGKLSARIYKEEDIIFREYLKFEH